MANQDDTANPTRKRRNQLKHTAEVRAAGAASDSVPPPLSPPQTMEEAIERVRTLLLEVRAMLHCLSEVLQYSDDNEASCMRKLRTQRRDGSTTPRRI